MWLLRKRQGKARIERELKQRKNRKVTEFLAMKKQKMRLIQAGAFPQESLGLNPSGKEDVYRQLFAERYHGRNDSQTVLLQTEDRSMIPVRTRQSEEEKNHL